MFSYEGFLVIFFSYSVKNYCASRLEVTPVFCLCFMALSNFGVSGKVCYLIVSIKSLSSSLLLEFLDSPLITV